MHVITVINACRRVHAKVRLRAHSWCSGLQVSLNPAFCSQWTCCSLTLGWTKLIAKEDSSLSLLPASILDVSVCSVINRSGATGENSNILESICLGNVFLFAFHANVSCLLRFVMTVELSVTVGRKTEKKGQLSLSSAVSGAQLAPVCCVSAFWWCSSTTWQIFSPAGGEVMMAHTGDNEH